MLSQVASRQLPVAFTQQKMPSGNKKSNIFACEPDKVLLNPNSLKSQIPLTKGSGQAIFLPQLAFYYNGLTP